MPRGKYVRKTTTARRVPRNGFKINRRLYDSLVTSAATLVKAYADGLRNGGSVDWSTIDRAHEHAVRAQRQLLRRGPRRG